MERIYLDNAATTPLDNEVKKAMEPYFDDTYGNPNSLHWFGQQARAAIDRSRETIANSIGARFREVVFTGSATEANNLAIRGAIAHARVPFGQLYPGKPMKIIVLTIEHESILDTARELEKEGVEVIHIPVDERGFVDASKIEAALDERTVLVSVMYANNEIGAIQPIATIAEMIKRFRSRAHALPYYPLLHTDAVQAFQFLPCIVDDLGVDLMTLSAHKIYGPKGVGALYVRTMDSVTHRDGERTYMIRPRVAGGGQEFGMRSGTENVAAIAGFAKAVERAGAQRTTVADRLARLRSEFWSQISEAIPQTVLNNPFIDGGEYLPNIVNVHIPGKKGGELLIALDMRGIAVSSGSACAAFSAKPSHVLMALGFDDDRAGGSVRFSLGRQTTEEELTQSVAALRAVVQG